jgi:phosphatidylglycerophosphatase A
MTPNTDAAPSARPKPRLALAIATSLGVGYAPKAPGTFGSLVGVALTALLVPLASRLWSVVHSGLIPGLPNQTDPALMFSVFPFILLTLISGVGVWSGSRVAAFAGLKDPQYVVIDEVSGQMLALFLVHGSVARLHDTLAGFVTVAPNWKYYLAGFILFRVFDIWKPFPIRRLENLPGGWGIMADDWVAGIYAAILLRLALHFGLV